MTNAEKQARYRQRALHDHDGLLLTRLQVLIGATPAARLKELVEATGRTQRDLVEEAIKNLHSRLGIVPK